MEFYDSSRPVYLETDASGVNFGARLLQVREGMNCGYDEVSDNVNLHPIVFASKSLLSAEWQYSNIEREALWILHGLVKSFIITVLQKKYL